MAIVTIVTVLVIAGLGGAGIYAIVEGTGGSKGPDISNSTIGNMEYDARSKQAIIGIDVDLRKNWICHRDGSCLCNSCPGIVLLHLPMLPQRSTNDTWTLFP